MTPPTPTRDTPAGQAYIDLRNLARRDGPDPAEDITLYALEGFLARLASLNTPESWCSRAVYSWLHSLHAGFFQSSIVRSIIPAVICDEAMDSPGA